LRGERNLWDIGEWRYLAMEKLALSGSLKTQPRPLKGPSAITLCMIFKASIEKLLAF